MPPPPDDAEAGGGQDSGQSGEPECAPALVAGQEQVAAWRQRLAERAAELIRRDPERAQVAVEMGLIDRAWLEQPGSRPVTSASTKDLVKRFLERSVEQRPSLLNQLGLSTIELLENVGADDENVDGDTRMLTVAFTDLEGFTSFTAKEGDDAANTLIAAQNRSAGPIVRSRGGKIVKRLGDGLLLTFEEPAAAVLACLELVDTTSQVLRLRAGVHVGEVIVRRQDVIGHTVNVAARVAEEARGGQVLATSDVRSACDQDGTVAFGRARRKKLKGIPDSVLVTPASLP